MRLSFPRMGVQANQPRTPHHSPTPPPLPPKFSRHKHNNVSMHIRTSVPLQPHHFCSSRFTIAQAFYTMRRRKGDCFLSRMRPNTLTSRLRNFALSVSFSSSARSLDPERAAIVRTRSAFLSLCSSRSLRTLAHLCAFTRDTRNREVGGGGVNPTGGQTRQERQKAGTDSVVVFPRASALVLLYYTYNSGCKTVGAELSPRSIISSLVYGPLLQLRTAEKTPTPTPPTK